MRTCTACQKDFEPTSANQKYCPSCSPAIVERQKQEARLRYRQKLSDGRAYEMKYCVRCHTKFKRFYADQGRCKSCMRLEGKKHDNWGYVPGNHLDEWLHNKPQCEANKRAML